MTCGWTEHTWQTTIKKNSQNTLASSVSPDRAPFTIGFHYPIPSVHTLWLRRTLPHLRNNTLFFLRFHFFPLSIFLIIPLSIAWRARVCNVVETAWVELRVNECQMCRRGVDVKMASSWTACGKIHRARLIFWNDFLFFIRSGDTPITNRIWVD